MMKALEEALSGNVTAFERAKRMYNSVRKIFGLKAKMKKAGPWGLIHGNRGRSPANSTSDEVRKAIGEQTVGEYAGASCAQKAELQVLREGIFVSTKTVVRILKESGIDIPHTHSAPKNLGVGHVGNGWAISSR